MTGARDAVHYRNGILDRTASQNHPRSRQADARRGCRNHRGHKKGVAILGERRAVALTSDQRTHPPENQTEEKQVVGNIVLDTSEQCSYSMGTLFLCGRAAGSDRRDILGLLGANLRTGDLACLQPVRRHPQAGAEPAAAFDAGATGRMVSGRRTPDALPPAPLKPRQPLANVHGREPR